MQPSFDPLTTLVTVIGGSGFIGRNVVRALAQEGYRIRVATRRPTLAIHLIPTGKVGQIAMVRADVRDEAQLQSAIRGSDFVINLVGILKEGGGQTFAGLHAQAPGRIADLCAREGVRRLIHMSSIGADEQSRSAYARTKAQGEALAREAFPDVTILRPSVVFGPDDGFFNRFGSLMRMIPLAFPLFGGGRTKFQPVFVGDVAASVVHVLRNERASGRTYELGGPSVYALKDLLAYVARVTERKRAFIPIPFFLLDLAAALTGWLPFAPITLDQARLLRGDNVVKAGRDADTVGTLADFGVQPTAVEAVAPAYLYAYRRTGQYVEPRGA